MANEYIQRSLDLVTKIDAEHDDRVIRFIGSTETPDRSDDIVTVEGWDVKNYLKNPVFLWAHDYSTPPIGKTVKLIIDKTNKQLLFDVRFPSIEEMAGDGQPSEHAKFVDMVYRMYKQGLLSATSVGFKGNKYAIREDQAEKPIHARGYKFDKQELLELSAVPVPANPEALAVMRSMASGNDYITKALDPLLKDGEDEVINKSLSEEKRMELEEAVKSFDERIKALEAKFVAETEEKAGSKYSKETKSTLKGCRAKLKECDEMLEKMVSDGVEDGGNEEPDGVEKPKAADPETVVEKELTLDTPVSELENLRF